MKTEVRNYKKEDAYTILHTNIREHDAQDVSDFETYAELWGKEGPAYTIVINDEIVFCGGVVLIGWNRGEAWTLMSKLFYKYPKTCFKICRDQLNKIIKEHGLLRVQALVDPKLYGGSSFMEHLGFEYEGLLRKYGPCSEDMIMYGRIK
jgi:hypothetical protein